MLLSTSDDFGRSFEWTLSRARIARATRMEASMAARVAGVWFGICLGIVAETAAAQSLGDVARQEAARRQQVRGGGEAKAQRVLTNADLPASAIVAPARASAATGEGEGGEAAALAATPAEGAARPETAGDAAAAAPKGAAEPTDDEAGWRDRAGRINTALAGARSQLRQLKALSERLSLEAQASNPAIAARAQAERLEMRAQIAQADEKVSEAEALHAALVHESRTAGVPPAWIQ